MRAARGRGQDELTGAARRRDARIALALGEQRESARRGHLDDRGLAIAQDAPLRIDLAQQRIVHARRADRAFRRANERVHGALAAVGKRQLIELGIGQHAPEAARDRGRDGDRIGAPLEGLRRDNDPVRNASEPKRVDGRWPPTEID